LLLLLQFYALDQWRAKEVTTFVRCNLQALLDVILELLSLHMITTTQLTTIDATRNTARVLTLAQLVVAHSIATLSFDASATLHQHRTRAQEVSPIECKFAPLSLVNVWCNVSSCRRACERGEQSCLESAHRFAQPDRAQ
jgi:uncharacterized membrane protein